jgi:uncharacterized protein
MSSINLTTNELLIADTGPLLALARVEFLESLSHMFAQVCVTQTVLNECLMKPGHADARRVQLALRMGWLVAVADPDVRASLLPLDRGEQTALEYALRHQAIVLIDEKLGRQAAKVHHLKMIGTLGILLLAKRRGLLSFIKPKLMELVASGYFLSDALIAQLLDLANE